MSNDGLNMPNVEMAFAAMEGKGGYEDVMQTPAMPRRVSKMIPGNVCGFGHSHSVGSI